MLTTQRFIFFLLVLLLANGKLPGQTVSGKLVFEKGKKLVIQMDIKTTVIQQAMENAIDFTAEGSATHSYTVTEATVDNTQLHHEANKIAFRFEGMGRKISFDSDNEKDMTGQFGDPVKNILSKKFDLTIDQNGKVLAVQSTKLDSVKPDERLTLVMNMLKDITGVVYPPKKGEPSFFGVLPVAETAKGDSWTDSLQNENGKFITAYTLSAITDSTVIVDFRGSAATVAKAIMMGRETVTTMNSTNYGTIILNKATGIVKEKTISSESNGNTEAMGGTVPVTAKTTIIIHVKPE